MTKSCSSTTSRMIGGVGAFLLLCLGLDLCRDQSRWTGCFDAFPVVPSPMARMVCHQETATNPPPRFHLPNYQETRSRHSSTIHTPRAMGEVELVPMRVELAHFPWQTLCFCSTAHCCRKQPPTAFIMELWRYCWTGVSSPF